MEILYDGKKIANFTANKSMQLEEILDILDIDIDESIDGNEPKWHIELFEVKY